MFRRTIRYALEITECEKLFNDANYNYGSVMKTAIVVSLLDLEEIAGQSCIRVIFLIRIKSRKLIRHLETISCAKWQNFGSGLSRLGYGGIE